MSLKLPRTPDRQALRDALLALKPLPEPELRDKMRHGPMLRAVRGLAKWQERADRIIRKMTA